MKQSEIKTYAASIKYDYCKGKKLIHSHKILSLKIRVKLSYPKLILNIYMQKMKLKKIAWVSIKVTCLRKDRTSHAYKNYEICIEKLKMHLNTKLC